MRPDPDSDLAGAESEYGDDTGFAAQATRAGASGSAEESAGLTAEDDESAEEEPGNGAD